MSAQFYKEILCLTLFLTLVFLTISCTKKEVGEKKIPIKICNETELPDALRELIEKKKENPFSFTYENSVNLYLAVGYGTQPRGEYVVAVKSFLEGEKGLYLDTTLVSLNHVKQYVVGEPSVYPYVVIRCEKKGKRVYFL